MANIIENVKEVRIRNASNGDYDLKFVTPSSDYRRLEEIALNSYPSGTATGNPIYFDDGADNIPVKELIVNLEPKQEGSGDPSPTNVRPISGHDGVKIKRLGKNLAQSPLATVYSAQNGSYSGGNPSYTSSKAEVSPNTEYTLSFGSVGGITAIIYYEEWNSNTDFKYISSAQIGARAQHTFTTPSNCHFVIVETGGSTTPITPQTVGFIQIEKGSTATDYEPYQGQEYSITFPSSVGTLYGGKLNVTTGLLTIDRYNLWLDPTMIPDKYIHFDVLTNNARVGNLILTSHFGLTSAYNAKYSSEGAFRNGALSNWSVERNKGYSSDTSGFYFSGTDRFYLFCPKSIFATQDASGFKQYLTDNPLYICYELETPITYQLTPTEVSTLLMGNTIMSDGEINLTYRQDTNTVIDRLTNAIISLGGNV